MILVQAKLCAYLEQFSYEFERKNMFVETSAKYNFKTKSCYGPPAGIPSHDPESSIGKRIFNIMKLKSNALALISDSEGISLTYDDLLRDSIRIAQYLHELELKSNDIVGIISRQTISIVKVMLACYFNTTPFHAINPNHEQAVQEHLLAITRPNIIFCESLYYPIIKAVCQNLHLDATIYTTDYNIKGVVGLNDIIHRHTLTESFYKPKELLEGATQTVSIINSSGTTGPPKAVCISNETTNEMCDFRGFNQNDIILSFSPIDWMTSTIYTLGSIFAGATRVITTTPFTPQYLLSLLTKYKITVVNMAPTNMACLVQVEDIDRFDFSRVRQVSTGGSMLSSAVRCKMRKLLKDSKRQIIKNCYGSTEAGVITSNWNDDKPTSVGRPLRPFYQIKIIDEEGRPLGVGELGEILLKNGKKWNGYYGNPEESAKMQDSSLWFHTGDLGYVDKDGDLFVVDRKKDILKYRNIQYSPQEIEQSIAEMPQVIEVCVFGNTNETEGDRAAAAIVRCSDSQLTAVDVIKHVEDRFLVEWKRLNGGVFFLKSLPKNENGKILRRSVKEIALKEQIRTS